MRMRRSAHCASRATNRCRRSGRSRPRTAARTHDRFTLEINAVRQRLFHRYAHHRLAGLIETVGNRAAPAVIDADDGGSAGLHAGDQTFLYCRVVLDGAVAIEMIFADVEQDADARIERGTQIDLVRRHFDHMNPAVARRLERQDRGADIAAHLNIMSGFSHQVRDQGGRRGLAVGAGDRDERRVGCMPPPLAAEQLDIADHLDASLACRQHGPVRLGMRQRNAGRQHQRREILPRHGAQIRRHESGLRGFDHAVDAVVARHDIRATGLQRLAAGKAGAAEAEHGNGLAGE